MSRFEEASRYIAGGVNSPVRAFRGVGGEPLFIRRARGASIETEDGRRLVDYVGSWGPMILGHADPDVIAAVTRRAADGLSFGAPTVIETELARRITELVPSIERLRMVSSGTEATMSAIRLARGFTGRDRIVKFEGCYHGHADGLLVKAGSGALTLGVPDSAGVPAAIAAATTTLPYNDAAALERCFTEAGREIACVIVEPVAGNMGCVPPAPGFLEALRAQCTRHGALLIFDEVMTGFRVALGGAQALYGITPDLTTLGKIVGGGMPVGAFGGRRDVMERLAPLGPVYQAGTLSGNPVAMAAGLATLEGISRPGFHARLAQSTNRLVDGLEGAAQRGRDPARGQPRLRHVQHFLHRGRPGDRLPPRHGDRLGALPPLLPRHARGRRLPRALALRGGLRQRRPRRRGDRRDARRREARLHGHRAGALMRAALAFLGVIFGTLLLAAALAWPAWIGIHALQPDWPFHRIVSRVWQLILLLAFLLAMRKLRLRGRDDWGYGVSRPAFLRQFAAGLGIGVATMLPMSIAMHALGIHELRPEFGAALLASAVLEGALVGLVVAVIEETFFRGLMYRAIERESGFAAAAWCTALVYASIHFFARVKIPAAEVAWDSGFRLLGGALANLSHPLTIIDSFVTLMLVGLLLALARRRTGAIAACIGLHMGWVWVIKATLAVSREVEPSAFSHFVSRFDGYTGWLVAAWALLLILVAGWRGWLAAPATVR